MQYLLSIIKMDYPWLLSPGIVFAIWKYLVPLLKAYDARRLQVVALKIQQEGVNIQATGSLAEQIQAMVDVVHEEREARKASEAAYKEAEAARKQAEANAEQAEIGRREAEAGRIIAEMAAQEQAQQVIALKALVKQLQERQAAMQVQIDALIKGT